MAKVKLTKGEMKRQRDNLKQFRRYLPTLQLKKQQLQMKILEARKTLEHKLEKFYAKDNHIKEWQGLFFDTYVNLLFEDEYAKKEKSEMIPEIDIQKAIKPRKIVTEMTNIAGASVPLFKDVEFDTVEYDFYDIPYWVTLAIEELKALIADSAEVQVVKKQIRVLEHELRITTQRVNLFEKIKIPECKENIRKISIYLGDQQANAVGISKVAKKKVDQRNEEEALV